MKLSVAVLQLFLLVLTILTNFPNTKGKILPKPQPNPQVVIGFAAYQDPARSGTIGKCFIREFANRKTVDYYSVKFYLGNELEANREVFIWRSMDVKDIRVHERGFNYPEYMVLFLERYGHAQKKVFSCAVQIGSDGPTFYSNQWNTTTLPVIPTKEKLPKTSYQQIVPSGWFWGSLFDQKWGPYWNPNSPLSQTFLD